jgi:hypothetical protein
MGSVKQLYVVLARYLAAVTLVSAVLTAWALAERSDLGASLAVLFVVAAFAWSVARYEGGLTAVPELPSWRSGGRRHCTGCTAGCAGCRERIDLG